MSNNSVTLFLAFLLLFSFASCNSSGLSEKQKNTAQDAIKALRKTQAASQGETSYLIYSQLVVDMKANVLEAQSVLPDGKLKSEILSAADAYEDASQLWVADIARETSSSSYLLHDYLKTYNLKDGKTAHQKYGVSADISDLNEMQKVIWDVAGKHVDKASILL